MNMGFTTHKHLDLRADDEDPYQLIIRPGWDSPHVRCLPRVICAWPCLLRQVGTALGSPCDCIVTGITYANPGSRHKTKNMKSRDKLWHDLSTSRLGTDHEIKNLKRTCKTDLIYTSLYANPSRIHHQIAEALISLLGHAVRYASAKTKFSTAYNQDHCYWR